MKNMTPAPAHRVVTFVQIVAVLVLAGCATPGPKPWVRATQPGIFEVPMAYALVSYGHAGPIQAIGFSSGIACENFKRLVTPDKLIYGRPCEAVALVHKGPQSPPNVWAATLMLIDVYGRQDIFIAASTEADCDRVRLVLAAEDVSDREFAKTTCWEARLQTR